MPPGRPDRLRCPAVPDEHGTCPACLGQQVSRRRASAAEPEDPRSFALSRCGRCGTETTRGPVAADAHDRGAYRSGDPRLSRLAAPLLRRFDRRRLTLASRAAGPIASLRLLDVGAGRGRFVAYARALGVRAEGLEPSRRGVQAARATYGVELRPEPLERARVDPGSLDVVSLWHVLEHLEDPQAAIATVYPWLAPGGVLLVGVPNRASLQAAVGGARWFHLDLPRHRTHFTPAGIRALLTRHGLTDVRVHHVLLEHNPFGMWQSLVNRVTPTPSYLYNLLKRNVPLRPADLVLTFAALPLAPAAAVLELCAGLVGRGGTIAVTARRPD